MGGGAGAGELGKWGEAHSALPVPVRPSRGDGWMDVCPVRRTNGWAKREAWVAGGAGYTPPSMRRGTFSQAPGTREGP